MKKLLTILSGITLAIIVFFQGSMTSDVAFAAEPTAQSVKQSDFQVGIWGTNNDGEEILVALYNNGKQDIAYVSNGNVSIYRTYTIAPAFVKGATNAQRFTIGEVSFTYCEIGDGSFILTDDGDIYSVTDITAYEVEQLC